MSKKDFRKFAIGHVGVNRSSFDSYSDKVGMTPHILDDPNNGAMVDIFSKMINNRIIFLITDIESDVCNIIKAQLMYLEQLDDKKDIKLYIDSGGGSVYSGLGLLDTMEYVKPDIITVNTGLAASMAAVLLCSGAPGKRKALKRSRTMIHQPLGGFNGYQQVSEIEIDYREINSLKKEMNLLISKNTGQKYKRVKKDCDRNYWMTAEDALKYGMIDEIVQRRK